MSRTPVRRGRLALLLLALVWLVLAGSVGAADIAALSVDAAFGASAAPATAIVVQDQVPLRAAPRDSAAQQAVLWQGDTLEVRGLRLDYLQVYDHRRERGGYVRASQVRRVSLRAEDAAELLAVVRFLRDTPGAEALGMAYVAAYLRAAPGAAIGSEPFAALGTLAERLARRASSRHAKADDAAIAAHLEVAASLGVDLRGFERDGRMTLCYAGDAFRRVLALPAPEEERARAALALTRDDCIDPALKPLQHYELDQWRSEVLARVVRRDLPAYWVNRLRLRNAGVQAALAFARQRRGEDAHAAAELALQELAGVDKNELAEEDRLAYSDAALRVGASRWAAEPVPATPARLAVATAAGAAPGETCIDLVDRRTPHPTVLAHRCTFGVVWTASASANAAGTALALAVQPLAGWRELWVFQQGAQGWRIDVLPPSLDNPELGYVEFAGWVPGKAQLLAAREVRADGRFRRSFELLDLATLGVRRQADRPEALSTFYRWQDAAWKRQTVALR
ncbi:MAG TPA: hypothetical protein PLN91_08270 [Rhodanobacteraceae bacterium]|nr:hypothetical protein [Rhodanobacteraceae bacterium]